jgi:hypothetical protein
MKIIKQNKLNIFTLMLVALFIINSMSLASALTIETLNNDPVESKFTSHDWENGIDTGSNFVKEGAKYNEDFDVGSFLSDNSNEYSKKWDPWLTKAAIRAVATSEDGDYLALAGGYLYDNQIHLYRWNYLTDEYDLVWEIGGGIFKSDVTSLAFADTDYNNLMEIIAGSEDGYLYVFEQRHIYDPITNTENMFDLVWKSPHLGRILDVIVDDTDGDYRKDIIVGTHDTVRWFEYDTHGNYPFTDEHWIEFKEVFSYQLDTQITALGVADLNYNGLKEVAVGLYSGEIVLLENNGTTLDINGYPYPYTQDNSYKPIWSSGNMIRRPISSITGGDLDGDGQNELLVAAQGVGAYVLDNTGVINDNNIAFHRLERPFDTWETPSGSLYPLDHYADRMVNSSSWFNNTDRPKAEWNVYYQNATDIYIEPLNYTGTSGAGFQIFPYNSYSVMDDITHSLVDLSAIQNPYTTYDGTSRGAWAVYDWGHDEEAAGNGAPNIPELIIYMADNPTGSLSVSLSVDNMNFFSVPASDIKYSSSTKRYSIEVDPTLADANLNYYRYINVSFTGGIGLVNYLETKNINNPIYDALSTAIGPLRLKGDNNPRTVGFIGTIDGTMLAVGHNSGAGTYEILWDSWREERWKLGTNVFDLAIIKRVGRIPAWMNYGSQSYSFDVGSLPDGGQMVSYTAENFYNYKNGRAMEFIISSTNGNLMVYTQDSPSGTPYYSQKLTEMLLTNSQFGAGSSVNTYMNTLKAQYPDKDLVFTANMVPVETLFANEIDSNAGAFIDPVNNGYWMFLGVWDQELQNSGSFHLNKGGVTDVSVWFLTQRENSPADPQCGAYAVDLQMCAYFTPLYNSTSGFKKLTNMELSGVMPGIFSSSVWMPKVAAADFIGDEFSDLILTNGKVHLLETILSIDAEKFTATPWDNPLEAQLNNDYELAQEIEMSENQVEFKAINKFISIAKAVKQESSLYNFMYRGDYFYEINHDSKGRVWTNAQPVDFDNDGDFDLILGYARYNEAHFGFNKVTYGVTYWENKGSRDEPKWVEMSKAITNNDPESNLRVNNFTEPVITFENYNFPEGLYFDSKLGYHPLYKDLQPTQMFMLQTPDQYDIFKGKIVKFEADYSHETSLLAATYPLVQRIDINLQYDKTPGLEKVNYGFHIFQTWDNEKELEGWTLSMASADLDQDGKNELVVGDFNNNIYVFEHLQNNFFKRAYKSFDVNRTIETDQSPYAHEQFGGMDGTFKRTIFEHVKHLIAGVDLNNNGLLEFVAATDTMIFIFESVTTSVGYIRDDSYQLVAILDMYEYPQLSEMATEDIFITSMAYGDDVTLNGKPELIVGVNSALLILEFQPPEISGMSVSSGAIANPNFAIGVEEIFMADSYQYRGLYDLPGNYLIRPNYRINSILVEDLDRDGRPDIVVAGVNQEGARPLYSGFISVMEWQGSSFGLMVPEDTFSKTTIYNPVNDLSVDDSDYDGHKELIIAHNKGIDIYEFVDDDTVEFRQVITSNPHYQLPERYYQMLNYPLQGDHDIVRTSNGTLLMAYIANADPSSPYKFNFILTQKSNDNGETWIGVGGYWLADVGSSFRGFEQISITQDAQENIWISYLVRTYDSINIRDSIDLVVRKSLDFGGSFSGPAYFLNNLIYLEPFGFARISPNVFPLIGVTDQIGLAFNYPEAEELYFVNVEITPDDAINNGVNIAPWAKNINSNSNYTIHSLDVVQLTGDGRDYGIVFSGFVNYERRSLDWDLFYANFRVNNSLSMIINYPERPSRIFSSAINAYNPSIIQERHTGNLLVTFEQTTLRPYGGLFAVWSNNEGRSWNGPYDMSHPLGFDIPNLFIPFPSKSGETYRVGTSIGNMFLSKFEPVRPVVAPGLTRGFTMTYTVFFGLDIFSNMGICGSRDSYINQASSSLKQSDQKRQCDIPEFNTHVTAFNDWSNFTWYEVGAVTKIAVGDSDKDGRHEILAASGKNAMLFEFANNRESYILHKQVWTSPTYDRDIVNVAISDLNGNGAPELIIQSDRGVVHSYEVTNLNPSQGEMMKPYFESTDNQIDDGSGNNYINDIHLADITGDGIDDIISSGYFGEITAIDGSDFSPIYKTGYNQSNGNIYPRPTLRLIWNNDTSQYEYIVQVHRNTIFVYDIFSGVEIESRTLSSQISSFDVGDLIIGGVDELIIQGATGYVAMLTITDLSTAWNSTITLSIGGDLLKDVRIGNFTTDGNTIAYVTQYGQFGLLSADNGGTLWTQIYESINLYSQMTIGDFNGDGFKDIAYGDDMLYAVTGLSGELLWNVTIDQSRFVPIRETSITIDINGDGIDDIITNGIKDDISGYIVEARDGTDGRILWTYRNVDVYAYFMDLSSIKLGDREMDVITISVAAHSGGIPPKAIVLDAYSGVALAAVAFNGYDYLGKATTANLEFEVPVLVIGDNNGAVHFYSLWQDEPKPEFIPPEEGLITPFIRVGSEFTRRTKFLLHDAFNHDNLVSDVGPDGWDDIFVVDDYYIGAASTYLLQNDENYNEVMWETDAALGLSLGRFLGQAKIGDIDGDGIPELVAAFENYLIAINIEKGPHNAPIMKYEYPSFDQKFRNFQFHLVNFDGFSGNGLEIAYSQNVHTGVELLVEFGVLDGAYNDIVEPVHKSRSKFVMNAVTAVADLDNDGKMDFITHSTAQFNPLLANFTIFDSAMNIMASFVLAGLPPVSHIAAGDFDPVHIGDEFILFFDYSLIYLPAFAFLLEKIPTIFLHLAWDQIGGALLTLASDNILGLSPMPGFTRSFLVSDFDNNGRDDLLIEGRTGDLTTIMMNDGNLLMQNTGVFDTVAVPYSRTRLLLGDFCGTNTWLHVSTGNTVSCYNQFNFSSTPLPLEFIKLDFNVIQDVVAGNLDDGLGGDDFIVVSRNGFVWIVNDIPLNEGLRLAGPTSHQIDQNANILNFENYGYILGLVTGFSMLTIFNNMKKRKIKFA